MGSGCVRECFFFCAAAVGVVVVIIGVGKGEKKVLCFFLYIKLKSWCGDGNDDGG